MAREILASMGLELHPGTTRIVDLREGREGFDFLGCHVRARMSGRLWEQKRVVRYYLHRWPSQAAMKRLREKARQADQWTEDWLNEGGSYRLRGTVRYPKTA
jgi:RNA-directed DNA polymerase